MENGKSRLFQFGAITLGIAGRGGDEFHALIDDERDDVRIAHKGLGDVDAKRLVREFAHFAHFFAHLVEPPRRGFDDAQAARIRDGRGKLRAGNPAHRRLHNGIIDTEHVGDAVPDGHGLASGR